MDNEPKTLKSQRTDKIALHKVSGFLLSREIITASPEVDMNGADLLAIIKVQDGAKFARIQCKGRTLTSLKSKTSIKIKKSYVTGTFTLLLYVHCPYDSTEHLFCFFAHDIKGRQELWKITDSEYRLSLYGKTFGEKFDLFGFTESRVKALKEMIEASDMDKEFYYVFGKVNGTESLDKVSIHVSSS